MVLMIVGRQRDLMRSELDDIRSRWNGPWWIGGDWNIIRFPSEKLGCNRTSSVSFSDCVNKHSLMDLPLGGARLSWSNHQSPPSFSCLDRFLISIDRIDLFPEVCWIALPKSTSDHCPILYRLCQGILASFRVFKDFPRLAGQGFWEEWHEISSNGIICKIAPPPPSHWENPRNGGEAELQCLHSVVRRWYGLIGFCFGNTPFGSHNQDPNR